MNGEHTDVVVVSRCAWTLHNFRRNLIHAIQQEGLSVTALGAPLGGYEDALKAEGISFKPIPVPIRGMNPLGDIWLMITLYLALRRLKPRVAHLFTIKPVIYGTLVAAAAGVPVKVCTITGLGHAFTDGGPLLRGLAKWLYRIALRHADRVFFQNHDDRALFLAEHLVAPDKTTVVPGSGVDLHRFSEQPFEPGLETRAVRFLMLSRLIREKGVLEFARAAKTAAAANLSFRLVGASDSRNPTGLSREQLEEVTRSPVELHPAVEDVRPQLAWADVVVLPSYREGTPRSLLEAMATGRPIVTTDTAGCRDLVKQDVNGKLAPVKDVEALSRAMVELASDVDRLKAMGAESRRIAARDYDERSVIAQTIAAYGLPAGSAP